jgi:putative nucleotidyltransferase with HDIG domain
MRLLGVAGACGGVTLAMFGYTALFCPLAAKRGHRSAGLAFILLAMLGLACVASAWSPGLMAGTATAPTLLVAVLVVIGYDRRSALAYGLLHATLVCLALREGVGTMAVTITGIACVVWMLREIRDRGAIMRASLATATGLLISTVVFAMIERPLTTDVWTIVMRETLADALIAAGGAVGVGGATLFVLPLVEKAFNVTTGLTLIELRDPKQPLLRELQQRAPGTYNHSLSVAAIAEAAADAINADPLLAYVGALYHDIGKMNKPEYFVENQTAGINKHDKLSPAMSLLVVVGHVKDGMELAREFRLPTNLQHFIEAHHGTTLVEFFYHRARQRALEQAIKGKEDGEEASVDDTYVPDEFEYRYPGPKPRTREVAILMIADAVESATRALGDPSPSKIEALVRAIANKRLMDGQFDDCELTLRELSTICESIIRTLTSMYHGRIAYPGGGSPKPSTIGQVATPSRA